MFTPSKSTSTGFNNSIFPNVCPVFSSFFSKATCSNMFLECSDDTKVTSILFNPSIQSGAHTVASIPAVNPMLYFPIGWNSDGIVHCAQMSGLSVMLGTMYSLKKDHSLWSSQKPHGVVPHLCASILTSYLSSSIIALIKSLDLAP